MPRRVRVERRLRGRVTMARKKDRKPKANPQSARLRILAAAGVEPTSELLRMPWADFTAKFGEPEKKPRRKRKSKSGSKGGTKPVTVTVGETSTPKPPPPPPTNAKPPDPKSGETKPRTKPKAKKPSKPKAATPNLFSGNKGSQFESVTKQQFASDKDLAGTKKTFGAWLSRNVESAKRGVGVVKREALKTVSGVNRIQVPKVSAPKTSSPKPPSPKKPSPKKPASAAPRRAGMPVPAQISYPSVLSTDPTGAKAARAKAARGQQKVASSALRAIRGNLDRSPASGRSANATRPVGRQRPAGPRTVGSVKTQAWRRGVAHGWKPQTPRVTMAAPPLPGTGGNVGLYGSLERQRREYLSGTNFRDRAPVVRDLPDEFRPSAGRPTGMPGTGMGSGSPKPPTTPTGRPRKTTYTPPTLGRPARAERPKPPEGGKTTTRPATPISPNTPTTRPSSDIYNPDGTVKNRMRYPGVPLYTSDSGTTARRVGKREVLFFTKGGNRPILSTPVSNKAGGSTTRVKSKNIAFGDFARDVINDLERGWSVPDVPRGEKKMASGKPASRAQVMGQVERFSKVWDSPSKRAAQRAKLINLHAGGVWAPGDKKKKPASGRSVSMPDSAKGKASWVSTLQKRGLLGLIGGASATGIGVAADMLMNPAKASAPPSKKALAEQRRLKARNAAKMRRARAATRRAFPTYLDRVR